jgi:hypothetical protein
MVAKSFEKEVVFLHGADAHTDTPFQARKGASVPHNDSLFQEQLTKCIRD